MTKSYSIVSIGVPPDTVEYFVARGWRLRSEKNKSGDWICKFVEIEHQNEGDVVLVSSNLESHFAVGETSRQAAEQFIQRWDDGFSGDRRDK